MTDENRIKSGVVVRLRSGGPWMTAGSRETDGTFLCHWFTTSNEPLWSTFHPDALISQDEDAALPGGAFVEYAERAYQAYGNKADWKNFQGNPMPTWEDLPENIRTYWTEAASQVIEDCNAKYNAAR